jgi:hypothetical protein
MREVYITVQSDNKSQMQWKIEVTDDQLERLKESLRQLVDKTRGEIDLELAF